MTTETDSEYHDLEKMPIIDILTAINHEDKTVPLAIEHALPQITALVGKVVTRMQAGGRLFYIGAGTSGRLGIVDASECPPTFGVSPERVIGLIAGGDTAIRRAVEFAEDNTEQAWQDLLAYQPTPADTVIGIAASGSTPYSIGGVAQARQHGLLTGCIVCNAHSQLAKAVEFPIEVVVGAEFLTGSTRMKAGTAQKLVLNMISTAVMIQLGHVKGNKMVDMQLSNHKLWARAIRMLQAETNIDELTARTLLEQHGSVRNALAQYKNENLFA